MIYNNQVLGSQLTLVGNATYFLDEKGQLSGSRLFSPSSKIVIDDAESAYYYKSTCTEEDYIWVNIQLNHDRKHGALLSPHLHWQQTSATIPHWVVQYRYQRQGISKTTSWTAIKWTTHAFTYTSGTLNQITDFTEITPTGNDDISDIVQIRILRDTNDFFGLFSGVTDAFVGNAYILEFDIHKECDTGGSNEEYRKI